MQRVLSIVGVAGDFWRSAYLLELQSRIAEGVWKAPPKRVRGPYAKYDSRLEGFSQVGPDTSNPV